MKCQQSHIIYCTWSSSWCFPFITGLNFYLSVLYYYQIIHINLQNTVFRGFWFSEGCHWRCWALDRLEVHNFLCGGDRALKPWSANYKSMIANILHWLLSSQTHPEAEISASEVFKFPRIFARAFGGLPQHKILTSWLNMVLYVPQNIKNIMRNSINLILPRCFLYLQLRVENC